MPLPALRRFYFFSSLKKEDIISEEQDKIIRQVGIGYEQLVVLSATILLTALPTCVLLFPPSDLLFMF